MSAGGRGPEAADQLRQAAAEADQPSAIGESLDRASVVRTIRARQAVRTMVQELELPGDELPVWAGAPIPDAGLDLATRYTAADTWPAQQAALDTHRELFTAPGLRITLHALAGLNPTNPVPSHHPVTRPAHPPP